MLVPAHVSAFEMFYAFFQAVFVTRDTPMFASSMIVLRFAIGQLFLHYHLSLKLLKKDVSSGTVELEVLRADDGWKMLDLMYGGGSNELIVKVSYICPRYYRAPELIFGVDQLVEIIKQ
ncbi:hypothetical protein CASFOL_035697 [Castilleja foliolosa]|uniref:Uncharacterized protein n=1 Tax=Castilleja foliolosa TaxID=1961234 RepID=A0ABD3BVR0_9LAMI